MRTRHPNRLFVGVALGIGLVGVATSHAAPFELIGAGDDLTILQWDAQAVREAASSGKPFTVRNVPLTATESVDLELRGFRVASPGTKFVIGRKNGADEPFDFDVSSVTLLRGAVANRPGSHVFLALHEHQSTGYVDLGYAGRRYQISSKGRDGISLEPGSLSVFVPPAVGGRGPDVPLCGNDGFSLADVEAADSGDAVPSPGPELIVADPAGLKHIELAVETDFEYFSLFKDEDAAAAYLVAMYGAVSDIYIRDTNLRVELVFARLWTDPDDLFNDVDPSPLPDFRSYWNQNMQHVDRDVAQLFSGRRDYPFGGQAYLDAMCGNNGYSVVGYAMGFFPDPSFPSIFHYDIAVTAHELGHNVGTGHTQDQNPPIDQCHDPSTVAQRGTIMSYCAQTWSGNNANRDLYFHSGVIPNITDHVNSVGCIPYDCNSNSIDDTIDIALGTSEDTNGNGIPDECEDCNDNGVLDPEDIALGTSTDVNNNGIPDDCEPDCNGNGSPDTRDIAMGVSVDAYGNAIPDECEEDCNENEIADYTELQLDMPLDINRNRILDQCEDCDGDGTIDLVELGSAHRVWLASGLDAFHVTEFTAVTGVRSNTTSGADGSQVNIGQDVAIAPDGRVLVSSGGDNRVAQFSADGTYLGDLIEAGAGGLDEPAGLFVLDGGTLLVASRNTDSVLAYNVGDGTPGGAFIASGAGGLVAPFGLTHGPNGNVFVASGANEVIEYDGADGSFIQVLVSSSDNGGLDDPRGLAFKPDGNLLVASFGSNETLEFDGTTGAPLGKWAQVGTASVLTQISPWGVRVGPNGNVFVSRTGEAFGSPGTGDETDDGHHDETDDDDGIELHLSNAQVYEFDARTGLFIRSYVAGNDHGHVFPTGFAFVPGWDVDCNLNDLPDECDIASGFSQDADESGAPDECEVDCNANGVFDRFDVIPYGASPDCNGNLSPDACDLSSGISVDTNGNGVPDECDADCNANGIPDDLDIAVGTSEDCDANGVPDECDPDCNDNGEVDACDVLMGISTDCNADFVPDECQIENNDCDENGTPDDCQADCDGDGEPDICERIVLFADDFENDLGWTVENLGASAGDWERGDPVNDPDWDFDPFSDGDGSGQCYVTDNSPGNSDVDNGAVQLTSPVMDMSGPDVRIRYLYFLRLTNNTDPDELRIEVSSNGLAGPFVEVLAHESNSGLVWRSNTLTREMFLDAGVVPSSTTVVRFIAVDANPQSVVEAAVDGIEVSIAAVDCNGTGQPDSCDDVSGGDFDASGSVGPADVAALVDCLAGPTQLPDPAQGGCATTCLAAFDSDGDGDVDSVDVSVVLNNFTGE